MNRLLGGLCAVAISGVALAACGEKIAETGPTAVRSAAQADGAEAFIRSLYLDEQGGTAVRDEDPDAPQAEAPSIWSARTNALIAEIEQLGNPGEYGYFEADPICACQDDGGMMLRSVTVTPTGANTADAAVALEWSMAEPVYAVSQTFNLVREGGAWKIDDIEHAQQDEVAPPSLIENMTRWITERKAERAAGG